MYKCDKCNIQLLNNCFPSYGPYDVGKYIRVDVNCYYKCTNCNYSGYKKHVSLDKAKELGKNKLNIVYTKYLDCLDMYPAILQKDVYVKDPKTGLIYIYKTQTSGYLNEHEFKKIDNLNH